MLLVVEHGLYPPELDSSEGWHDRMFVSIKGSYSRLSYSTNDGIYIPLNRNGGTGITITADIKSRIASKGVDLTKLGRLT